MMVFQVLCCGYSWGCLYEAIQVSGHSMFFVKDEENFSLYAPFIWSNGLCVKLTQE